MRRPRHKLQVSTFPFLAVLLCAMGSLLLFLFIMDRRAKIAAQHANDEILQARKQRSKNEEDELQAEWEKAKAKLHQALVLQEGQLAAQGQVLQIDLDSVGKKLRLVQAQQQDLDEQAKAEAAKIAEIQVQIISRRNGLLDANKKETMSKKELIAAAQELAELEIALQQLLEFKDRAKDVHSLVPYHGKRGDSRPPIYIECVRDGVIFHPDDRALRGFEFTAGTVRFELERRAGPLTATKTKDDKLPADKQGIYVLFLVRPSGINTYYLAQAALKGFRLDFGYELIDQNWELDFAGGTRYVKNGPIGMPVRRTEMPIDDRPVIEAPTPIHGGGPASGPSTGFGTGPIGGTGPGGPGGVPRFGAAAGIGAPLGTGVPGGSGISGGSGTGTGPAFVPINRMLPPVPIASTAGTTGGNGPSGIPGGSSRPYPGGGMGSNPQGGGNPGVGVGVGLYPPGVAIYPGGGGGGNQQGAGPHPGGGPGPLAQGGIPQPGGGAGSYPPGAAQSPGSGAAGSYPPGTAPAPGSGGAGSYPPGATPAPGSGGAGSYPPGAAQAPGSGGAGVGNPNGAGGGPSPGYPTGSGGAPNPAGPDRPPGSATQGNPGGPAGTPSAGGQPGTGGGGAGGGNPEQGDAGGDVAPPSTIGNFANNTKKPRKASTTPALSKLLGNKDFLITIDCYNDYVNVFPGGMSFRWTTANMKATDEAFAHAVANLIERRQASVRPGEPPYRPIISFRVTADGRLSCLHTYPLLEPLNVPMTRENIVE